MIIAPEKFMIECEKGQYPISIVKDKVKNVTHNPIHHYIIPGIYERSLIDWATQYLRPNSNFVDIGAHIGSWTLVLAEKVEKVYAFEAQRSVYFQLCGNIALNNLDNVYPTNIGLGNYQQRGQSLTMRKHRDDFGSSTFHDDVKAIFDKENLSCTGYEEVKFACLDDYNLDNISLIKIDVEGFELNVLQGGIETITRNRPTMILEVWRDPKFKKIKDDVYYFLDYLKYQIIDITGHPDYILCQPL